MADRDAARAEVEALLALVVSRHGDRLDGEQMADVRRIVEGLVDSARALRAVDLDPSLEPHPPFAAHRSEP